MLSVEAPSLGFEVIINYDIQNIRAILMVLTPFSIVIRSRSDGVDQTV
jgi:hypothetical protein